jgi:hypothetical protein
VRRRRQRRIRTIFLVSRHCGVPSLGLTLRLRWGMVQALAGNLLCIRRRNDFSILLAVV